MKTPVLASFALVIALTACAANPTAAPSAGPTPAISLTTALESEMPNTLYTAERFATGVIFPIALEFAADGRLFVAEKNGTVRIIGADGQPSAPVLQLTNIDFSGERGLLGMTLDPNFATNGYLWVFYTRGDALVNRISRFTLANGQAVDEQVSFEFDIAFKESSILNGGGLRFGPDGMLYIAAGSTNNVFASNEPGARQARIHRVDPTTFPGAPAPGNPDPASTTWASGLRNVFDMAFHPASGQLFATENGGDCDDEINIITAGGDYGWHVDGACEDNALPADYPYQRPLLYFTPTIGPTGITIYQGEVFPEWQNNVFFCGWHNQKLVRLEFKDEAFTVLKKAERIETGADKPCTIDVAVGPDGLLYYSDVTAIHRLVRSR